MICYPVITIHKMTVYSSIQVTTYDLKMEQTFLAIIMDVIDKSRLRKTLVVMKDIL